MLRKKQLITQQNKVPPSQQITKTRNAKVTVQYIQEQQQLIQKPEQQPNNHMIDDEQTTTQDDLEIENVEYLEENPSVEEFIEEPTIEKTIEFEDTFYPNAIHCLLDLYKNKYDKLSMDEEEESQAKVTQLWLDIAKDMQERYFEFNEEQIRQKYILLREQYFGLPAIEDIEKFDYFEQLHDIYKDCDKENILKGLVVVKEPGTTHYYKDEVLFNTLQHLENNDEVQCHDFKSEEIVHKEHEFIDMVEKELQAMEGGIQNKECKGEIVKSNNELEQNKVKIEGLETKKLKRIYTAEVITTDEEPPTKRKTKANEYFEVNEIPDTVPEESSPPLTIINKLSLFEYNEQQERRHREKMDLLEKSLNLQKHAIEQQNQLLQELIKRLPI